MLAIIWSKYARADSALIGVSCPIAVGGPGQLEIIAGRNVNLGIGAGVTTNGDLVNPNVPTAAGASITVLAGAATAANLHGALTDLLSTSNTTADLAALNALPGPDADNFASAVTSFNTTVVQDLLTWAMELVGEGKKRRGKR